MTLSEFKALRLRLITWLMRDRNGPALVNIRASKRSLRLLDTVPATRADCPDTRPCPHVRCRWHLWRVDSDNRAGRPGLAHVPRDVCGRTLQVKGDMDGERPGTTLMPRWLEVHAAPSCTLDEIDSKGRLSNAQTADAVGRHCTLVAREAKQAVRKAQRRAQEMGIHPEDFMRTLIEMGEK